MDEEPAGQLDFNNTEIAFGHKSDKELKFLRKLFSLFNNRSLVNIGTALTPLALKLNIPFVESAINATIFKQFVGGASLLDTQTTIDLLNRYNILTILDYGAESKSSEEDLDFVMEENIKAIEFAASNNSVPALSTKPTGLAPNELLVKLQSNEPLNESEKADYEKLKLRLNKICKKAYDLGVSVMIDAEESWMQITIDSLVEELMKTYNSKKVIVYNTYQLYRHDKLEFLKLSYDKAREENYMLGAKLVRGAYMDKENEFARQKKIPSVVHDTKDKTDSDYNAAIRFCVDNYQHMASVCATHNKESNLHQARLIEQNQIDKGHPHLNFCQLLGMGDNLTFNLAKAGFNVAKYVPYGPLKEVIPYLLRRAKENTSVTGDMSRELKMISTEIRRRSL